MRYTYVFNVRYIEHEASICVDWRWLHQDHEPVEARFIGSVH